MSFTEIVEATFKASKSKGALCFAVDLFSRVPRDYFTSIAIRFMLVGALILTLAQSTPAFAHSVASINHEQARKLACLSESKFEHHETDFALKLADEAILCDPQSAKVYSLRGCILAEKKLFARAANDFSRSIALAPEDENMLIDEGLCYYDAQHDSRNSNLVYTKALSINPDNTRALALRGLSFELLHDGCHAIGDLNRAIKISPQQAKLFSCRGLILRLQQRYKEALVDYAWATKLDPSNPFYLQEKAYTNLFLDHATQGLQDIDLAIKLNPTHAGFHVTRAELLNELGNFADAIIAYDTAEKLGATSIFDARAEAKMDAGQYREALVDWTREINDWPKDATFFLAKRGNCYIHLQLWDKAFSDLNAAITAGGDYPFIHKWRAQVYSHFGKYDAAVDDLTYALTFFPKSLRVHTERAEILLERARVQEKLCKYDLAFNDLIDAQRSDHNSREIYLEFCILWRNYIVTNGWSLLFSPETLFLIGAHRIFRRRRIRRLL